MGWARVQLDAVDLMFSLPNDHLPFEGPAFTGSLFFYTDNIDQLWEKYQHAGRVAYPIDNFEHGMREFAIHDNNGYMLQFGEELPG